LFLKTALDNVLIDGTLAGLAVAQVTPSTYCAGVPGCEVLNIEPLGGGYDGSGVQGGGLIKYCRNGVLNIYPFYWRVAFNTGFMTTYNNAGAYAGYGQFTQSAGNATSWTTSQMCANLP